MSPSPAPKRRIVVTGMGAITPVGNTVASSWQSIIAGKSGIGALDYFDASSIGIQAAAQVKNFDPSAVIDSKDLKKMDLFIQYGLCAAEEAWQHAQNPSNFYAPERIGVALGSGVGGIGVIEAGKQTLETRGARRISPFFVPSIIINMLGGYASMRYDLRGPNFAAVSACATGAHNIGMAARLIASGDADCMLAGGAEACITSLTIAGFAAARALSTSAPEHACCPFDKNRNGFVMGEGAGVLVLEEFDQAVARGAPILAELSGFGMSADAHHITMPTPDGSGAARAMANALADAALPAAEVDYVNAHGTSTPAGDHAEVLALQQIFGADYAQLPVSSTKSMTGHLLGAAGGVEAIFAIQALRENTLPPTIHYQEPDETCPIDCVANQARAVANARHALSNSFGFGGTNASLIFSKI